MKSSTGPLKKVTHAVFDKNIPVIKILQPSAAIGTQERCSWNLS